MTTLSRQTHQFLPILAAIPLLIAASARADGPYTAISIDSLTCSTGSFIVKGETAIITCEASDEDTVACAVVDDDLTFSFTATGGTTGDLDYPDENDPNKVTIPWTADCAVGTYTITVTVDDVPNQVDDTAATTQSVTVQVVDIDYVKVRRKDATSDPFDTAAEIVAGGYGSDIHSAQVAVKIAPVPAGTYSIPVPVTLSGADAAPLTTTNAKLTSGTTIIQDGSGTGTLTITNTNSSAGERIVCLVSSNVVKSCGISAGGRSATIDFVWDNQEGDEFAVPPFFLPGIGDDCTFTCRTQDGTPIKGHTMLWETASVSLDCYEWNTTTGDETYTVGDYGRDATLPFALDIDDFVAYTGGSESPDGVYSKTHTVSDYFDFFEDNGSWVWQEALVVDYGFSASDDNVYGE